MPHFVPFTEKDRSTLFSERKGEVKVGEMIMCCEGSLEKALINHQPEFVIIGIPEGFGALANYGRTGTEKAWECFLSAFLNMQENRFFSAKKVMIAGCVDVQDLQLRAEQMIQSGDSPEGYRELVEELDQRVYEVLRVIFSSGALPIVIGGGHNNAYPIIQAANSSITGLGMNVLNIDPHADFRAMEGRHSGNPFTYAMDNGFLHKYFVAGLHKHYNSEEMLSRMDEKKERVGYVFFEKDLNAEKIIQLAESFFDTESKPIGFEVDTDSIAGFPVSALTPFGFSLNEVIDIITNVSCELSPIYLHLPEASPGNNEKEQVLVGKALALMALAFLNHREKN